MKYALTILVLLMVACNQNTTVKLGGTVNDTLPMIYMTAGPTYVGYDSVTRDGIRHSIRQEVLQTGKLSETIIIKGDTMMIIKTLLRRIEQAEERNSDVWRHYGQMMEQVEEMGKLIKELKAATLH